MSMHTTPTQFVIYRRVSSKKQGQSGLGLESQTAYLEHYLSEYHVVADFEEVASAKTIEDRPLLREAIKLCVDNGYHLAVAKVDRLSRNTEQALGIYNDLDGRLFCADLPMSPTDRVDKFTLTIFLAIADRERELISIRTKQGLAAKKAREGQWVKPQSLVNMSAEGRASGRQAMQNAAKQAYKTEIGYIRMLRESGVSYGKIASRFNDEGKRTRNAKLFTATTIKRIMDREQLS